MERTPFSKLTRAERKGVMRLAEYRVRAGEPASAVCRALDIPYSTFKFHASRGQWRIKDLEREAEGLPPLPRPKYAARPERRADLPKLSDPDLDAGTGDRPEGESPLKDVSEATAEDLAGLLRQAEREGKQALRYYLSGHRTKAEIKLKDAARLARLHRQLSAHLPPEPTPAELEERRVREMSREDLIAAIQAMARAARPDSVADPTGPAKPPADDF